jgi:hypothetical protein
MANSKNLLHLIAEQLQHEHAQIGSQKKAVGEATTGSYKAIKKASDTHVKMVYESTPVI